MSITHIRCVSPIANINNQRRTFNGEKWGNLYIHYTTLTSKTIRIYDFANPKGFEIYPSAIKFVHEISRSLWHDLQVMGVSVIFTNIRRHDLCT